MQKKERQEKKVGLLEIIKSVVAAMFGVQSDKNRQRDFNQTSMVPYLLVGLLFVVLFVVALIGLVSLIAPG